MMRPDTYKWQEIALLRDDTRLFVDYSEYVRLAKQLAEAQRENVDKALEIDRLERELAEAKKDAARWAFFVELFRKDDCEVIGKFLPEEPENCTKEIMDAVIDQAMKGE